MDNRALTLMLLIAVLLVTAWYAEQLSRMPLTWQTLLAVSATLAFVATVVLGYIVLRGRR